MCLCLKHYKSKNEQVPIFVSCLLPTGFTNIDSVWDNCPCKGIVIKDNNCNGHKEKKLTVSKEQ